MIDILEISFESGDLGETLTIREYFVKLVSLVWEEGDAFNGKRPFGNSGWKTDLIHALAENGVIDGTRDSDDGWIIDERDFEQGEAMIQRALEDL